MSALNLNKVILVGHLTNDPELKQTPSGVSTTSFSVAVNRRLGKDGNRETDFITVVAWRQTAEFVCRYFKKGSAICVVGSIQTRKWQDKEGNNRYATEVVADVAYFVDSKLESGNYDAPAHAAPPTSASKFEELKTDDDLPF